MYSCRCVPSTSIIISDDFSFCKCFFAKNQEKTNFLQPKTQPCPGNTAGIRFYVYQNDVRADPFDAIPGDNVVIPVTQNTPNAAGGGDNDGVDPPLWQLHNGIGYIPQPPPVANANNFLTVQVRKTM